MANVCEREKVGIAEPVNKPGMQHDFTDWGLKGTMMMMPRCLRNLLLFEPECQLGFTFYYHTDMK